MTATFPRPALGSVSGSRVSAPQRSRVAITECTRTLRSWGRRQAEKGLVGGLRPVRRHSGPSREPHLKREVMQDQAPLSLRLLLGTEQVTEPGQESRELHAAFKLAE